MSGRRACSCSTIRRRATATSTTSTIVGLVESEWPERPRRNIFYPPALLQVARLAVGEGSPRGAPTRGSSICWRRRRRARGSRPSRSTTRRSSSRSLAARRSAARAAVDRVDAPAPSTTAATGSSSTRRCRSTPTLDALLPEARARGPSCALARSPRRRAGFHGAAGPQRRRAPGRSARSRPISAARSSSSRSTSSASRRSPKTKVMDPRRQGQFVHEVFERSSRRGRRRASGDHAAEPRRRARSCSPTSSSARSSGCRQAEAALERTRLLGSPAAAGLGEAVFRMEAERPVAVVERLLEHTLDGDVHDRRPQRDRAWCRSAARPIASTCSPTARSG